MNQQASLSGSRSAQHSLAIPVTLLVVLLSTRFGGFFSLPPNNISAFWPANALLFSAVFLLPARQGWMTLLLALPAYAAAELWIGYPLRNAIVYGFANVAEVSVLLWLLKQTATRSLAFDCLKDLFLLLSLALLAASVGGAIGAMEVAQTDGAFGPVLLRWGLADFFGYCLFVPLVLTWRQWRQTLAFESPARIMEFAVLLMFLLMVSVLSSGIHVVGLSAPLGAQFLPLPVLLWAALRFGPPGGAIATVIVACVAFYSATHGVGLFAIGAPEDNVASLQLFFAALVISVMTIASLNAERKKSFDILREEVAERMQAEEALKKSETLLNITQRLTKVGGWEFDIKSGKFLWTEELYRIHEISDDPGMDLKERSLACYRPEDRRTIQDTFQRACQEGESYDLEFPFTTYTGKPLWIRTIAQAVYEEGKVVRVVGNLMDITERKQAEEEIRRLNQDLERRVAERTAELQAANRELETFTYSVSHDLRQPLRTIDGFLGLLKKRIRQALDGESRRYMTTISEAAVRMATLIDDLLSFSRSGRFEMRKVPVDLGALVREVVREHEPATAGRVVDWRIGELPVVIGDRAMLQVVLGHLVSNALKFTQPRERAEIEIGSRPGGEGEAVVFVRDNGVGFDMKYADKLFRVFERLHGVDEFKGTGIGLANVRRAINRHGGRTWAEGKIDGGATFYFSLPRTDPSQ